MDSSIKRLNDAMNSVDGYIQVIPLSPISRQVMDKNTIVIQYDDPSILGR